MTDWRELPLEERLSLAFQGLDPINQSHYDYLACLVLDDLRLRGYDYPAALARARDRVAGR